MSKRGRHCFFSGCMCKFQYCRRNATSYNRHSGIREQAFWIIYVVYVREGRAINIHHQQQPSIKHTVCIGPRPFSCREFQVGEVGK